MDKHFKEAEMWHKKHLNIEWTIDTLEALSLLPYFF